MSDDMDPFLSENVALANGRYNVLADTFGDISPKTATNVSHKYFYVADHSARATFVFHGAYLLLEASIVPLP